LRFKKRKEREREEVNTSGINLSGMSPPATEWFGIAMAIFLPYSISQI
jgi:hypothetical protein